MNFGIPFALGFEKVFQRGILILSNPQLIHQHFYKRSIFIRKSGRRRRTTGLIGMVFALLLLFSPSFACAVQITLAWDSNVEPDVAGYIVYYGTRSGDYDFDVDVGDYDSITISGLAEDVMYYFTVTAYDVEGNESGFSEEITFPDSVSSPSANSSGGGGDGGCFISSISQKSNSPAGNTMIQKFALITLAISLLLTALLSHCAPLLRGRQQ
jgi:hypothetical protein